VPVKDYSWMNPRPQLRKRLLTTLAATALVFGGLQARAEEVSEHIMTAVSGTQISGYVITSFSWQPNPPSFTDRPTLWSLQEALSQPVRESSLAFDPLASAPFEKMVVPENLPHSSGREVSVIIFPFANAEEREPRHEMPESISVGLSAVPEPGTMALLGLGAAGACWHSKRRKRFVSTCQN
jgi:hypothetical protein